MRSKKEGSGSTNSAAQAAPRVKKILDQDSPKGSGLGGRELLESDIQNRIIDRARGRNVYVRKMVAIAYRGFPDLFMVREGVCTFWEIKRVRGTVTKVQRLEHRRIELHGGFVIVAFGLWDAFQKLDEIYP